MKELRWPLKMLVQGPVKCSTETLTVETAMKKVMAHLKEYHPVESSIILLLVSPSHLFQKLKSLHRLKLTDTEKVTPVDLILLHLSTRLR